jgi:hypothetical protein
MVCGMKDTDSDEMSCQCLHSEHKAYEGITISKFIKGCCNVKYTELNNTSLLFKIQNDNNSKVDFHIIHYLINNVDLSNNSNDSDYQNLNFHPPKYDIPISVSSLLI